VIGAAFPFLTGTSSHIPPLCHSVVGVPDRHRHDLRAGGQHPDPSPSRTFPEGSTCDRQPLPLLPLHRLMPAFRPRCTHMAPACCANVGSCHNRGRGGGAFRRRAQRKSRRLTRAVLQGALRPSPASQVELPTGICRQGRAPIRACSSDWFFSRRRCSGLSCRLPAAMLVRRQVRYCELSYDLLVLCINVCEIAICDDGMTQRGCYTH
jgi:hypothetical protein